MRCEALDGAAPGDTPFTRDIVFDWYDGPVAGVVECGPGGAAFAYRMVAWDDQQTQRIYVLQPLTAEGLAEAAARDAEPRVTHLYREDADRAWSELERILLQAGPIEYVVQCEDEIPGPLRSVHPVRDEALRSRIESMIASPGFHDDFAVSELPFEEWAALLREMET